MTKTRVPLALVALLAGAAPVHAQLRPTLERRAVAEYRTASADPVAPILRQQRALSLTGEQVGGLQRIAAELARVNAPLLADAHRAVESGSAEAGELLARVRRNNEGARSRAHAVLTPQQRAMLGVRTTDQNDEHRAPTR